MVNPRIVLENSIQAFLKMASLKQKQPDQESTDIIREFFKGSPAKRGIETIIPSTQSKEISVQDFSDAMRHEQFPEMLKNACASSDYVPLPVAAAKELARSAYIEGISRRKIEGLNYDFLIRVRTEEDLHKAKVLMKRTSQAQSWSIMFPDERTKNQLRKGFPEKVGVFVDKGGAFGEDIIFLKNLKKSLPRNRELSNLLLVSFGHVRIENQGMATDDPVLAIKFLMMEEVISKCPILSFKDWLKIKLIADILSGTQA